MSTAPDPDEDKMKYRIKYKNHPTVLVINCYSMTLESGCYNFMKHGIGIFFAVHSSEISTIELVEDES